MRQPVRAVSAVQPVPELIQVVKAGDFESVLSFGVGVAKAEPFRMYALPRAGQVVLQIRAPYWTVPVRDYFLNTHRFAIGWGPVTQAVSRQVIPPSTAFGALQRLFAGPTQAEQARGVGPQHADNSGIQVQGPDAARRRRWTSAEPGRAGGLALRQAGGSGNQRSSSKSGGSPVGPSSSCADRAARMARACRR